MSAFEPSRKTFIVTGEPIMELVCVMMYAVGAVCANMAPIEASSTAIGNSRLVIGSLSSEVKCIKNALAIRCPEAGEPPSFIQRASETLIEGKRLRPQKPQSLKIAVQHIQDEVELLRERPPMEPQEQG
jgi:hypothetical protein